MSVLVQFGKRKAILRTGRWLSADLGLERRLNEGTVEWIHSTGGPALSDKDQERTVANHMAERHRGRVLIHVPSQTGDSSKYFLEKRQMSFEFDGVISLTSKAASKHKAPSKNGSPSKNKPSAKRGAAAKKKAKKKVAGAN